MKKTLTSVLALTSILSFPTIANDIELKPLTKEELMPFCQNAMLWEQFNVTAEKCLEVSVPCSKETLKPGMALGEATEALYSCAFSKLGIEIPSFDEDDDDF